MEKEWGKRQKNSSLCRSVFSLAPRRAVLYHSAADSRPAHLLYFRPSAVCNSRSFTEQHFRRESCNDETRIKAARSSQDRSRHVASGGLLKSPIHDHTIRWDSVSASIVSRCQRDVKPSSAGYRYFASNNPRSITNGMKRELRLWRRWKWGCGLQWRLTTEVHIPRGIIWPQNFISKFQQFVAWSK